MTANLAHLVVHTLLVVSQRGALIMQAAIASSTKGSAPTSEGIVEAIAQSSKMLDEAVQCMTPR